MNHARRQPFLLLALLFAGCAAHPHKFFQTGVDGEVQRGEIAVPERLLAQGRRLPSLAVQVAISDAEGAPAPGTEAAESAVTTDAEVRAGERGEPLEFDAGLLADEVVATLESTGVFEGVFPVGRRLAEPDIVLAGEEARAKGASFLLDVEIARPSLRRTDRELIVSTVTWAVFGLASFWLHNHTYALDLDVRLRVVDLNADSVLPEQPIPPGRTVENLNFFERTSSVFPYLFSWCWPTPIMPVGEDKIARTLATGALRAPLKGFLQQLAEGLDGNFYQFAIQHKSDGPTIEVHYPPGDTPVYLLGQKAHLSLSIAAPPGRRLTEVRFGDEIVFPHRASKGRGRQPIRRRLRIETRQAIAIGQPLVFKVKDTAGRVSRCLLVPQQLSSGSGSEGGPRGSEGASESP